MSKARVGEAQCGCSGVDRPVLVAGCSRWSHSANAKPLGENRYGKGTSGGPVFRSALSPAGGFQTLLYGTLLMPFRMLNPRANSKASAVATNGQRETWIYATVVVFNFRLVVEECQRFGGFEHTRLSLWKG